jgi:hypothetical protein
MSELVMEVLDATGDTKHIWDKGNPDEVKAARKLYDDLKKKGYTAFRVDNDGDKNGQMWKFDADAEKMIMVPRMVGG